jgi:hypothetical protein
MSGKDDIGVPPPLADDRELVWPQTNIAADP